MCQSMISLQLLGVQILATENDASVSSEQVHKLPYLLIGEVMFFLAFWE